MFGEAEDMKCSFREAGIKKEPLLNGSLDFTGTEALRTYMKFASLSAAYIHAHTLNIDEPATSCMAV